MSQKAAMRRRKQMRNGYAHIPAKDRPGYKRAGGTVASSIAAERAKAARMAARVFGNSKKGKK